jgi:hypothetical protein
MDGWMDVRLVKYSQVQNRGSSDGLKTQNSDFLEKVFNEVHQILIKHLGCPSGK